MQKGNMMSRYMLFCIVSSLSIAVFGNLHIVVDSLVDSPPNASRCLTPEVGLCNIRSAWLTCTINCSQNISCTILLPRGDIARLNSSLGTLALQPNCTISIEGNNSTISLENSDNVEPHIHFISYDQGYAYLSDGSDVPLLNISYITLSDFENSAVSIAGDCEVNMYDIHFLRSRGAAGGALYIYQNTMPVVCKYCVFDDNSASGSGGAIFIEESTNIVIENSHFLDCEAGDSGGAIAVLFDSRIYMRNSSFTGSICGQYGGSLYLYEGVTALMQAVQVTASRSSQDGGAVYIGSNNHIVVEYSEFVSCQSSGGSGGMIHIYQANHYLEVRDSSFRTGQSSKSGGCVSIGFGNENVSMLNSEFIDCESTGWTSNGGCVSVLADNDNLLLSGLVLSGCYTTGNGGGAYVSSDNRGVVVERSIFEACVAGSDGGGLFIGDNVRSVVVLFSDFIACESTSSNGGAVFFGHGADGTTMSRCRAINCTANVQGGGVFIGDGSMNVMVELTLFDSCSAASSGGALAVSINCANMVLQNNSLQFCHANSFGGALYIGYLSSSATVKWTEFISNSALFGGAAYLAGENDDIHFVECDFRDNYAAQGGALSASKSIRPVVAGCTLKANYASVWGAGLLFSTMTSQLLISDSEAFYQSLRVIHNTGSNWYYELFEIPGASTLIIVFDSDVTLKSGEEVYIFGEYLYAHLTEDNIIPGKNAPPLHVPTSSVYVYLTDSRIELMFSVTPVFPVTYSTRRTVLEGNIGAAGGGLMLNRDCSFGIIINTDIRRNLAISGSGGGIYLRSANTGTTVQQVHLVSNVATSGGGGLVVGMAHTAVSVIDCLMLNNTAGAMGGAMVVSSENGVDDFPTHNEIVVSGCFVVGNTAAHGGGIAVGSSNQIRISSCTISGNTAPSGSGGGLLLEKYNTAHISDSVVRGNTAAQGGGVLSSEENILHLAGMVLSHNSADIIGGALLLSLDSELTFEEDNLLINNSAGLFGGAIASMETSMWTMKEGSLLNVTHNAAPRGSGVFFKALKQSDGAGNKEFTLTQFYHNEATVGGTVYWLMDADMTEEPLGLNSSSVLWMGNRARYGNRTATQAVAVFGPESYTVMVYGEYLKPPLEFQLRDFYNQTVLLDDSTSMTATIVSGSENCDGKLSLLMGQDVVGDGVSFEGGVATYSALSVRCSPGGSIKVEFQANLGNVLGISDKVALPYYISHTVLLVLRDCLAGEYQSEGECIQCSQGMYNLQAYDECVECLSNNGVENCYASQIIVNEGYWRRYAWHETVQQCPVPGNCRGGNETGTDLCSAGAEGVLCAVCSKDYFMSAEGCTKCEGMAILTPQFIIFTLIVIIGGAVVTGLVFMPWCMKRSERSRSVRVGGKDKTSPNMSRPPQTPTSLWDRAQIASNKALGRLKIGIATYQVVSQASSVLSVDFPSNFRSVLHALSIVNLDFIGILPLDCAESFSFIDTLVMTTLLPIALCGILYMCFAVEYLWRRHNIQSDEKRKKGAKRRAYASVKEKYLNYFFYVTYLVLPAVTTTIFKMFLCTNVDPNEEDDDNDDYFLTADMNISCRSSYFYGGLMYACVMIMVYPVGVLSLYVVLLNQHKHEISTRDQSSLFRPSSRTTNPLHLTSSSALAQQEPRHKLSKAVQGLSFLWEGYSGQHWYFEIVETIRRLTLTALLSVCAPGSSEQAIVSILLALCYLKLYSYCSPYAEFESGIMAEVGQYQILFTFFGALIVAHKLVRSEALPAVGGCLVVINLSVVLLELYFALMSMSGGGQEASPHDSKAERPPESVGAPFFAQCSVCGNRRNIYTENVSVSSICRGCVCHPEDSDDDSSEAEVAVVASSSTTPTRQVNKEADSDDEDCCNSDEEGEMASRDDSKRDCTENSIELSTMQFRL